MNTMAPCKWRFGLTLLTSGGATYLNEDTKEAVQ